MVSAMAGEMLRGLRRLAAGGLRMCALLMLFSQANALAQDPPVTFTPAADAYVLDGAWSGSNFGGDAYLYTRTSNNQNYESYLKFDTTGVGTVASAKLRLNASVSANANIGLGVYAVASTDWSESAITWNNKPARGALLGGATVTGTSFVYYEIDVTSYLAAEKAAGRNVVSFALHNGQSSNQYVWIRSREATSNPPQLIITPHVTVVSLLPAVSTVTLGASTSLALTISSAQATDTVVPITASPAGIVLVPDQVTIPAGQTSVQVPVGTLAYGQAGITASLNGASASAGVNVVPPPVAVTALEPATFTMTVGANSTFTVRINAAQVADTEIALAASDPSVLQVPAAMVVPQGATSATFTATGLAVGDSTITASANGTSRTASVHVSPEPAAIVSLLPTPLPLQQGATGSLTVTINVAQEAATTITLANSAPEVAAVPASVVIAAGAVSAQIPVTAVSPGSTVVTASVNGTSAAATVEVTPPPPAVSALEPAMLSLPKGTPGTLRVTVSRAPNVATPVALVSSDPAFASVPPQVNIPAGALFADFPVMANAPGQATITASLNGGSASSVVTVGPAELANLTLAPQAPTRYVGETVAFSASGLMTDGTTEDFTSRVTWSSSSPAVATISAGGVASALAAGQTTIRASYTFTAIQTGQATTVEQTTTLTVNSLVRLALSAPATTLVEGTTVTVTVTTSDPAPAGGLAVSLVGSGTGAGTFPPSVTVPASQTSTAFQFTATAAGSYTVTASAQNRLPGSITFSIQPLLAITGFNPTTGPVGTAVAISGAGFDPNLSGNQVKFNGEPAVIASGSATLLNAIVPPRATTGPITVTNVRGTATSSAPFTVQDREAFDITLAPAALQLPPGGQGAARIRLSSTGLNPYPYAAAITLSGLPAGVTVALDRTTVALGQDAIATFSASAGAAAGTFNITVTATGAAGVTTQVRTKTLPVEVIAAGATTVTGRVVHADDDKPFVGARIRLGSAQAFTDETGTYRFVNPPMLGDQVLLIDGNTNNTAQFEYPSGIAMPVMIVAGQDNKVLTSFVGRVDSTRFTAIVPGQAASVTDADIPNFSLNIPAGVTITGWDGQPVTKINVRKVPVDRLPIRPIPEGQTSKSVYLFYFFREGGGTPTTPIPVTVDNDLGALPGEQVEMWYYDESPTPDPNSQQWRLMGLGTVSQDGKTIVSNAGVGIPKFCCGAMRAQRPPPGNSTGANAGDGGGCKCANPVDAGSGNGTVFRPRPFGISKLMPVDPNLQYRSTDNRIGLFGRGMTFSYDWFAEALNGSTVRVTTPDGVQYMLSLEGDGKYRARSGRSGAIGMEVANIAGGRSLTLPDGTQYDFNSAGRLTAIRDLNGNTTTFQLDASGFPSGMTDAAGKTYTFTLVGAAPNSTIGQIMDSVGRTVTFGYDANRRLASYTDQGGGVTKLEYDAAGRISKRTDPRGGITQYEYDSAGRTTREILPEGGENRFAYTTVGATVTETRYTDPNGNVTTYRFNGLGYGTSITDALGRTNRIERDPITNLVRRRIDPAGRVTQYFYNSRGDLIRTIDADNKETLIDYDPRFRKPTRIQDALTHPTTMVYDEKGNLRSITNAENETATFTYTAKGQLETVTDPLTRVTSFTYDAEGNLLTTTNTAGETVTRTYDAANRLFTITDALGRITQFDYDGLDRLTEVRDAVSGLTKYAYDANDNLTSATDPNNNPVERNVYDLRNRLKTRTDAKNRNTSYEHDLVGNLKSVTDRKGQATTYEYDARNRVVLVQDPDRTTSYSYDLAGNLAKISDTLSGEILMSYDALDRLTEVVTNQGAVGYTYDAIGRRTSRTLSGGDVTSYTYDKVNRIKTVTLRGKTVTYNYDLAGRLTEKLLANGLKATYSYDAADRVAGIAYTKPDNSVIEAVRYAYDAGGQAIAKTEGQANVVPDTTFAATYDDANRLSTVTLGGETFALAYDENGNVATKAGSVSGTTSYIWSAKNQLVALSGPGGSATFKYDALGRRTEKTVNGQSTGFLYDGAQTVAEIRGGAFETLYHTGIAIDEVLGRYAASGDRTLLQDALMSVIAQTDEAANAENFYAYSAYGEVSILGPDGGNPLRYTGREDDGTGLYYYRARYYDPMLKRFISEDPIGLAGNDANLYAYVGGNPISRLDPLGLAGEDAFGGGGRRPPFGWPDASQQAQRDLARQLQQLWNESAEDKGAAEKKEQAIKKCIETICDPAYDRGRAWCESQWKMVGRQAEKYRTCMKGVRADYLKCIEQCKEDCK